MKLKDLKAMLAAHPEAWPRFILPDGDLIPAHFHITEVGHVTKRFIDCGGKLHGQTDICLLQTWVNEDDRDHRLKAGILTKILQFGEQVLPHDDMNVEVEYDCCVVAQYPVVNVRFTNGFIDIELGKKQTDCLAKERCGIGAGTNEVGAAASCC